jgi:CTP synthase (UTP-ammonia lyase)
MLRIRIALVGDFSPDVLAHQAINQCFALAGPSSAGSIEHQWLPTESIVPGETQGLKEFSGIWCVPASPYRNTDGALWAIQYARTRSVPFLGTCGGYQHALLEYARNVLGFNNAGHSELDPTTPLPLLHRMECSLVEESQKILITNEEFRQMYGSESSLEGFRCRYGLNPKYEELFANTPLQIVARSEGGQARACQLKGHPFFVGTQFQPERRALQSSIHPLVSSFFVHCGSSSAAATGDRYCVV